jgi:hypothetical protein
VIFCPICKLTNIEGKYDTESEVINIVDISDYRIDSQDIDKSYQVGELFFVLYITLVDHRSLSGLSIKI